MTDCKCDKIKLEDFSDSYYAPCEFVCDCDARYRVGALLKMGYVLSKPTLPSDRWRTIPDPAFSPYAAKRQMPSDEEIKKLFDKHCDGNIHVEQYYILEEDIKEFVKDLFANMQERESK